MLALIIIIGIILTIGFYSLYQKKKVEEKMKKFSDSRPYLSKREYIGILVKKGFFHEHVEIVYDIIKKYVAWDFFVMYPEDNIHTLYGVDDLEDVDIFDEICERFGLRKVVQKDIDSIDTSFEYVNAEYILTVMNYLRKNP